jgi:hypothetical protein
MHQGALGFLLYLAAVPLLLRLRSRSEPATVVLAAAFALWLLTPVGILALGQRVNFWAFSISYWFLVLCFLMAFGAIYKSISLRVVAHLWKRPDSRDALAREVLEASFHERLAIAVAKGYAERSGERLALTEKGRRIARRVRWLQQVYRIERSG